MLNQEKNYIKIDITSIAKAGSIILLIALLYREAIPVLLHRWYVNPAYSHAFLIPFICLYFLYTEKDVLISTPVKPSKYGLALFILCLLLFIIGSIGSQTISFYSLFLMIISLIYYHLGIDFLKKLWFPILLSFFTIPLPMFVYEKISFNLQLISSEFAVRFMQLFDIPVYNEGNVIHLFYTNLEVAEACSGIRSIISLITLAVIFSFYFQNKKWVRCILIISSLPIAILTNAFRVAGTGMIAHFWSIKYAQGFFHEFSGWLIFIAAFLMLFGENALINKFFKK